MMPEGVEVSWTAQWLNSCTKNKILTKITPLSGRYLRQEIPGTNILPAKVRSVKSHGKLLFFDLDGHYLVCRFGLTGEWSDQHQGTPRVALKFNNKTYYYHDQRNFGTLAIISAATLADVLTQLAQDVLHPFSLRIRTLSTTQQRKPIYVLLMNQTALTAGLGNYLTAESLHRAQILPSTPLNNLTAWQLTKLTRAIKYTVKLAYMTGDISWMCDSMRRWVLRHRKLHTIHPTVDIGNDIWSFNVYQQKYDTHGNKVHKSELIKGRTAYWSDLR